MYIFLHTLFQSHNSLYPYIFLSFSLSFLLSVYLLCLHSQKSLSVTLSHFLFPSLFLSHSDCLPHTHKIRHTLSCTTWERSVHVLTAWMGKIDQWQRRTTACTTAIGWLCTPPTFDLLKHNSLPLVEVYGGKRQKIYLWRLPDTFTHYIGREW